MKNSYICNCSKPNFRNNYSYWEDRNPTSDEKEIIHYLKKNINLENKRILHIGIGNSYFAQLILNKNIIFLKPFGFFDFNCFDDNVCENQLFLKKSISRGPSGQTANPKMTAY